jgi:hypothetical protein
VGGDAVMQRQRDGSWKIVQANPDRDRIYGQPFDVFELPGPGAAPKETPGAYAGRQMPHYTLPRHRARFRS